MNAIVEFTLAYLAKGPEGKGDPLHCPQSLLVSIMSDSDIIRGLKPFGSFKLRRKKSFGQQLSDTVSCRNFFPKIFEVNVQSRDQKDICKVRSM